MEFADVEPGTQRRARVGPQPEHLELADLVGEGLAGPHDVAVDLVGDVVGCQRGVLGHEVDRLPARPAERVHARVHDQATGAPGVEGEDADPVEIAAVEAHLLGKPLRVEPPAFPEGGHAGVTPELGQALDLLGDRDLQVMPGDRLVECEGFGLVARTRLRLGLCSRSTGRAGCRRGPVGGSTRSCRAPLRARPCARRRTPPRAAGRTTPGSRPGRAARAASAVAAISSSVWK